ncbi:MAG: Ribonuclease P protein component [uncultured bacterium]|nr:MAG: Ribonuclease P protein component [uncultured bacterium]
MLPAAQRLRRTSDIQSVYKTGRATFTPAVRVLAKATQLAQNRATVVVSTRVSKKAVERNRLKRQLRATLRKLLMQTNGTHDIVIIVQPKALKVDTTQLISALIFCFNKLHLL